MFVCAFEILKASKRGMGRLWKMVLKKFVSEDLKLFFHSFVK